MSYRNYPTPEEMEEEVVKKAAKLVEGMGVLLEDTDIRVYGLRHEKPIPNKLLVATRELKLIKKLVEDPLAKKYTGFILEEANSIIDTHRKWPRMIFGEGFIGGGADAEMSDREEVFYGGKGGGGAMKFLLQTFMKNREKKMKEKNASPPEDNESLPTEP